jgi:hypothetical protein
MRSLVKSALFVVGLLLPDVVLAEGAWVMWSEHPGISNRGFTVTASFTSEADCVAELERYEDGQLKSKNKSLVVVRAARTRIDILKRVSETTPQFALDSSFLCLPATVDPRQPRLR